MSSVSGSARRSRHRPWYRKIRASHIGLGVILVVVLLGLVFAWQVARATSALRLSGSQAQVLQSQIVAGDDVSAETTLQELTASAGRAESTTDGPLWKIGAKVPVLGKNVSAVRQVAVSIDRIARDALPPVVKLSKQINLNTYSPHGGKVDVAAIRKIAPSVATASAALKAAQKDVSGIDASSLLIPLRQPVSSIQLKIDGAESAAQSGNLAARLLPTMLGGSGTRHYLLLIQNNAEVRSTGGIAGSYAILTAANGKLSMGKQGSIHDLPPFLSPVVPMTKDEKSVFSPSMVTDLRDANFTPDFPRTAQITAAMAAKGLSQPVDGVISVDPVAMSYILSGTGPVTIGPGVQIDESTAVNILLSQVYLQSHDPAVQDLVFKRAARGVFNKVKSGSADSRLVIAGMVKAADENRLLIWSSHRDEERHIAKSGVSGEFRNNAGRTPHVGLYLGDAASTKMEYYLTYSTRLTAGRCLPGRIQELSTNTQIGSTAPPKLPKSVTGDGKFTPRGTMRIVMRFFAPYRGGFTEVRVNGIKQTVYADSLYGRNVTKVLLTIKPGETYTVMTSMITGKGQDKDPIFSTTPGVQSTANDVKVPSACG